MMGHKGLSAAKARTVTTPADPHSGGGHIGQRWPSPLVRASAGLGVLVLLVILAIVIAHEVFPPTAGPKNMLSDGIVLTSTTSFAPTAAIPNHGKPTATVQPNDGTAHIVLYEGMECQSCQQFEQANGPQLAAWLDAGTATVEIHPVAISDTSLGSSAYATRAVNALACVAQFKPTAFWAANKAFYDNMPKLGSNAKTNAGIMANLNSGGADAPAVTSCVKKQTFRGWAAAATQRVARLRGGGTPFPNSRAYVGETVSGVMTVIVNGTEYDQSKSDPADFATFVKSIAPTVG